MPDPDPDTGRPPGSDPRMPSPGPLAGRTVVVTRARTQASVLVDRLTRLGAAVVELPVIAIEDAADGGVALAAAAERIVRGDYGWVVVTSANAVSRLVDALDQRRSRRRRAGRRSGRRRPRPC